MTIPAEISALAVAGGQWSQVSASPLLYGDCGTCGGKYEAQPNGEGRWVHVCNGKCEDRFYGQNGTPTSSTEASAAAAPAPAEKPEKAKAGRALNLPEPEPWPEPVDGPVLADEVTEAIRRHVVMKKDTAYAVALWTLFTHVHDSSRICPILAITSPAKRCGKTTLISVVRRLVRRPLPTSNISPAAVYRIVEASEPTLLVDEADSFVSGNDDLRGVINCGHTRDTAFIIRMVGEGANQEPRMFTTWAPKAFAGIGKLPDTISDRSVAVRLERRGPAEAAERLDDDGRFLELARKIVRWAADNPDAAGLGVSAPAGLHDRAADNWRPLLSIAATVGGEWPERARVAAVTISGDEEDDSAPTLLLSDLRELFTDQEAMTSQMIVDALVKREDRPWAEWGRGKPLTKNGLAKMLRPFGLHSRDIRIGDKVLKGYRREDCEGVFGRYLPPEPPAGTATPLQPASDAGLRPNGNATTGPGVAVGNTPDSALQLECSGVAVGEPPAEDLGWE